MSDKHYVGLDLTGFEDNKAMRPVSRVTFLLDDENSITAGDDSGLEIVADNPHATQAMANAVLSRLRGYKYHAFDASSANLDPAAELGDGITVCGIYGAICRLDDGGTGYLGVNAPGKAELEDEYPSAGPMTQSFNRKLAQARSYITKTAEEIKLGVANDLKDMRSEIDVQLNSISLRVENGLEGLQSEFKLTAESLTTQISNATGDISRIEQYVDSITLSVSNGETSSTIALKAGEALISSQTITFSGVVTFEGLESGTTTINGAWIETGTISADSVNLTGAITWGSLDSDLQGDIQGAYDDVYALARGEYYVSPESRTFIDGKTIYSPQIVTNVLDIFSTGQDGNFNLNTADNQTVLSIYYNAPDYQVDFWSPYGATFVFSNRVDFDAPVSFNNDVSGVRSLSLSPADDKIQTLSANGKAALAKEELKKTIGFMDENGVLKIELPNATWYLDETGWHQ